MAREQTRVVELGEDPLGVAIANYRAMVQQLEVTQDQLRHSQDMGARLMQENEFLRREFEKAQKHRDQFQAVAINLSTRAVGLREATEALIAEAMRAGAAVTTRVEPKVVEPDPAMRQGTLVGPPSFCRCAPGACAYPDCACKPRVESRPHEAAGRLIGGDRADILPNAFKT